MTTGTLSEPRLRLIQPVPKGLCVCVCVPMVEVVRQEMPVTTNHSVERQRRVRGKKQLWHRDDETLRSPDSNLSNTCDGRSLCVGYVPFPCQRVTGEPKARGVSVMLQLVQSVHKPKRVRMSSRSVREGKPPLSKWSTQRSGPYSNATFVRRLRGVATWRLVQACLHFTETRQAER